MTEAEDDFQPVKSADRALQILEALAAGPSRMSLGDLQRRLGIPKSSLHGLLRTLRQRDWIEADDTGTLFGVGRQALRMSASYVESDDIVVTAGSLIDWLSDELSETVHLGRIDGSDVVYLAKRESTHPLRLYSAVGRRLPAHATALGKSLLAHRRDTEVDALLPDPLPALTANTLTERAALFADLEATRSRGYAIDNEETAVGIRCFAVSLTTGFPPVDAISLSIPTARLTPVLERDAVQLLQQAQARFNAGAGWRTRV